MSKGTIVVIEDEADLGDLTQLTLEDEGYKVILERDGEKGLDRIFEIVKKDENISLIIVDINIPGILGTEVIERLSKEDKTNKISVLISSVNSVEGLKEELQFDSTKYSNYEGTLSKPYAMSALVNSVKKVLKRGSDKNV